MNVQKETIFMIFCSGINIVLRYKQVYLKTYLCFIIRQYSVYENCYCFLFAGQYDMSLVRHITLDEADSMLDDSFNDIITRYISKFPVSLK